MDLGFSGRRALVTGGSRGIGRAIVTTLAREGAEVIFCGRDPVQGKRLAAELRGELLEVRFIPADMETDGGIDALAAAVGELGGVDTLVNNVGGSANPDGAGRGFVATPSGEWTDTFYKCVVGAVRLINHLAPRWSTGALAGSSIFPAWGAWSPPPMCRRSTPPPRRR